VAKSQRQCFGKQHSPAFVRKWYGGKQLGDSLAIITKEEKEELVACYLQAAVKSNGMSSRGTNPRGSELFGVITPGNSTPDFDASQMQAIVAPPNAFTVQTW
jgi:hypothetical protein